jgi:hypothetical protein
MVMDDGTIPAPNTDKYYNTVLHSGYKRQAYMQVFFAFTVLSSYLK